MFMAKISILISFFLVCIRGEKATSVYPVRMSSGSGSFLQGASEKKQYSSIDHMCA